jgi:hypothetical protein
MVQDVFLDEAYGKEFEVCVNQGYFIDGKKNGKWVYETE